MVHGIGVLLLGAIGGYWVLERAATHKGQLKQVGQLVGGLVILLSLAGAALQIWNLASGSGPFCPMGKSGKGTLLCPLGGSNSAGVPRP